MKYIILAPANVESGGPELAHQLCYKLNQAGQNAEMFYCVADSFLPQNVESAPKFLKYEAGHVKTFEEADNEENLVVIPEGLAFFTPKFKKAKLALWWMSVDNYYLQAEGTDECFNDWLERVSFHLVQSQYAYDFLLTKEIAEENILFLTDYLAPLYKKFVFPPQFRSNIILYNPKKGFDVLKPFIDATPQLEWKALFNLSEEEMVLFMQNAKIYIDFGHHPGKDRIPREAASCGCVVITNKKGSAGFYEDIPIDDKYKFDKPEESSDKLLDLIEDIFNNFQGHFDAFSDYRAWILKDEEIFNQEVINFLDKVEEMFGK